MQPLEVTETPLVQPSSYTNTANNRQEEPYDKSLSDYNMLNFVLTVAAMASSLLFHTFLLSEGKYSKTDPNHKGIVLSMGLVVQLFTYRTLSRPYTHLSRKYGNRNLARFGALNYLLSCLFCLSQLPILSNFFVCQFLSGNALTALLSVPFKSPDSSDRTKTKASVDLTTSTFLACQFVINVMAIFTYQGISRTSSQIYISGFIFLCITLGTFLMEKQKLLNEPIESARKDAEVKDILKSNKWLLISIVLRGAQILFFGGITTFATLYNYSSLILSDNKHPDRAALTILQIVLTVPFLFSKLSAKFLDKDHENLTINLSVFACLISSAFWIFVPLFGLETNWLMIFVCIISTGGGTCVLLVGDNINRRYITPIERNIIEEYSRRVHLIWLMILVLICGLLYDYWMKEAPFLIIGLILVVCGIVIKKTSSACHDVAEKVK